MSENDTMVPVIEHSPEPKQPQSSISRRLRLEGRPSWLRIALSAILIIGLLVLAGVGLYMWSWVGTLQAPANTGVQAPTTTFNVQRTAPYAGLNFTLINAQYAASFANDTIRSGPATVRLNMRVTNPSGVDIPVIYYDAARLLIPKHDPIAPTNVSLAADLKPHATASGWLDFPVSTGVQLNTLKLQLGSSTLGESLVTIPLSGPFNPGAYAGKVTKETLVFTYAYNAQPGLYLTYHLTSAERQFSYNGHQAKAGQQFYIFNFRVDNPNGADVNPGLGYDYIRLMLNGGPRAPIDNTLPSGFKAGAHGVSGRVVFSGPAGMKDMTLLFLYQYGQNGDQHPVSI